MKNKAIQNASFETSHFQRGTRVTVTSEFRIVIGQCLFCYLSYMIRFDLIAILGGLRVHKGIPQRVHMDRGSSVIF